MIEYKKILEIEYQLHSALRKAKREWDGYVKYGKDSALYTIAHEEVKALRQALKDLKQVSEHLRKLNQLEYSN
jgi:hypothetical protein